MIIKAESGGNSDKRRNDFNFFILAVLIVGWFYIYKNIKE